MRGWTGRLKTKAGGQSGSTERDARRKEAKGRWGQPCAASPGPQESGGRAKPCPRGVREPLLQRLLLGARVRIHPLAAQAPEGPLIPQHLELWALATEPPPLALARAGARGRRHPSRGGPRCGRLRPSPESPTFCSEPPPVAVPRTTEAGTTRSGTSVWPLQGWQPHAVPQLRGSAPGRAVQGAPAPGGVCPAAGSCPALCGPSSAPTAVD